MNTSLTLLFTALAASALSAQAPAAPSPSAQATPDPVVWSANQIYARQSKLMLAAAEEMPPEKYTYSPTPGQMTFAHILSHVAQSNGGVCGLLSDTPAPATLKVADTASKPELIAALKASFDFCDTAMAGLKDSQLNANISFRRTQMPRARALFELTADLADHYSQMAAYLRLSGLLPPSAQPRK